jgi:hypothetical protein
LAERRQKNGVLLKKGAHVTLDVELMNGNEEAREAVVTVMYEYVPDTAANFRQCTALWVEVGDCEDTPFSVPKGATVLERTSKPWVSTISGDVIAAGGHLHDGGTHVEITRNGKIICDSVAKYRDDHKHAMEKRHGIGMDHIAKISGCANLGRMEKGDKWGVNAYYNFSRHPPMLLSNGEVEDVMGVGLIWLAEDK